MVAAFAPMVLLTLAAILYRDHLQDLNTIGYAGIFLLNLLTSATIVVPVPGFAAAFAAGALWNPVLVALAGATGSTLGELTGYLAGVSSQQTVHGLVGGREWYSRVQVWLRRRGAITIFLIALIPNPAFDVVGFAAGSTGYPVLRFVAVCWLGRILTFSLVSMAGYWASSAVIGLFG